MRKQLRDILQQPLSITQHRQTLQSKPVSIQQSFYQNIGNIFFLKRKQPTNNLNELLNAFKGSFSNRVLKYKYMGYCMQKKLADSYYLFNVLNLLSSWIQFLNDHKKAKNLSFRQMLQFDVRYRGLDAFQDSIVYFHYIGIDLIGLLKKDQKEISAQQQKTQAELKLEQQIHRKLPAHLNATDLLWMTNVVLPKVLFNVIIPLDFFPENFLPFSGQNIDLLYHNQNIQVIARSKQHYQSFVMTLIRTLIDVELEQSQTKQLLLQSFKYYYLFHYSKQLKASQIVIDCFKKVSPAVRFALSDEILLFFTILKKIGKELFLNYLKDKFQWAAQLLEAMDDRAMIGNPKQGLKPSPMADLPLVNPNQVPAGKKIERFIEVYHKYSLLFFKFKAVKDDITFRLYYGGDFSSPKERKQLLITRDRESLQYQSSIEVVEAGIYIMEFDNSYSWMKAKNVYYEYTILVPMEIVAQKSNPWLQQIIFDKVQCNTVPEQKILRVIKDNEGSQLWRQQINTANSPRTEVSGFSVKVSYKEEQEVYNLYIRRADGTIYEYESEDKNLLIKKIKGIKSLEQERIDWFVYGVKSYSMHTVIQQLQQQRTKYAELDQEEEENADQPLKSEGDQKQARQYQQQPVKNAQGTKMVRVNQQCEIEQRRSEDMQVEQHQNTKQTEKEKEQENKGSAEVSDKPEIVDKQEVVDKPEIVNQPQQKIQQKQQSQNEKSQQIENGNKQNKENKENKENTSNEQINQQDKKQESKDQTTQHQQQISQDNSH